MTHLFCYTPTHLTHYTKVLLSYYLDFLELLIPFGENFFKHAFLVNIVL